MFLIELVPADKNVFVCKDMAVSINFIFYKFPLSFEGLYAS